MGQIVTLNLKIYLVFLLVSCFNSSVIASNVWFVSNSSNVIQDGKSWATAFNQLQVGIDAAQDGDFVFVANGIYQPPQGESFSMKKGVKIYGGFNGIESSLSQRTLHENLMAGDTCILQGNGNSVIYNKITNNSEGLTELDVIDGFTITGGNSTQGGGMLNEYHSSPTISNCIFIKNQAGWGGGICNKTYYSNPTIKNCVFINNYGEFSGGGIYNPADASIKDCVFIDNSAPSGGAIKNFGGKPEISGCIFQFNNAFETNLAGTGHGGAIENNLADAIIYNCIFNVNTSDLGGGAILNYNSSHIIYNCVVYENSSNKNGGAIFNIANYENSAIINSTFVTNVALQNGGAICSYNCHTNTSNSVFWENSASNGIDIYNDSSSDSLSNISFCFTQSDFSGDGNIQDTTNNPFLSVNTPFGPDGIWMTKDDGLQLASYSKAINSGNNDSIHLNVYTDIIGNIRVYNNVVDKGAYEYQSGVGVSELNEIKWKVYPNPASHSLFFKIPETIMDGEISIVAYNLSGAEIHRQIVRNNYNPEISLEKFPTGSYIFSVHGKKKILRQKVNILK